MITGVYKSLDIRWDIPLKYFIDSGADLCSYGDINIAIEYINAVGGFLKLPVYSFLFPRRIQNTFNTYQLSVSRHRQFSLKLLDTENVYWAQNLKLGFKYSHDVLKARLHFGEYFV